MKHAIHHLLVSLFIIVPLSAAELADYHTVATAITTTISKTNATAGQSGFLGIHVSPDPKGKLIVGDVAEGSPASKAGVLVGDVLMKLDQQALSSADAMRDALQRKAPGDFAKLTVQRGRKSLDLLATLAATSRPRKVGAQRAVIGIRTGEVTDEGAPVSSVTSGMPADKAGLKSGDVIVKVAGATVAAGQTVSELLADRSPGEAVTVVFRRNGEQQELQITLAADTTSTTGEEPRVMWKSRGINWPSSAWSSPTRGTTPP